MPRDEPIAPVDAAWLRMDQRTNSMVITSVLSFDEPLDFARIVQVVRERLLVHPRFRQRVAESRVPLALPRWVNDAAFDLRNHLHCVALPGAADEAALCALVSDRLSEPLPHDRPLFRLDVVERVGSCIL